MRDTANDARPAAHRSRPDDADRMPIPAPGPVRFEQPGRCRFPGCDAAVESSPREIEKRYCSRTHRERARQRRARTRAE